METRTTREQKDAGTQTDIDDLLLGNNVFLQADASLVRCPLSLEILKDPILLSDGHYYELEILLEQLRKGNFMSPMIPTHEFTHYTYSRYVDASLEKTYPNGRYTCAADFNKKDALAELDSLFETHRSQKSEWSSTSLKWGGAVGLFLYVNSIENTRVIVSAATIFAYLDNQVRHYTNNKFGLFSGTVHIIKDMAYAYHEYFQHQLDEVADMYRPMEPR